MSRPAAASFSSEVVAELAPHVPLLACCRTALLEGMRCAAPSATVAAPGDGVVLMTTRSAAARVALAVLHAAGVPARVVRRRTPRRTSYAVLGDPDDLARSPSSDRPCCRRSRLRGAVLEGGSFSRPDAPPHLEIVCASPDAAQTLLDAMAGLDIAAACVTRRGRPVVEVRSIEGVAAVLSGIGAQGGRLRFEEGRVVREVRATVNRRLNSETANLRRTVDAGVRQARAAEVVQLDQARWRRLPESVRQAALLRHRHPQESLSALAARAGTSRSAMAGRLRRLMETAAGRR